MSIIQQVIIGDYRKPTAISHIRNPLSSEALTMMEACCAIVQLSQPDRNGLYIFPKKLAKALRGWSRSNNYSVNDCFMEMYENDISWNILGEDETFEPCQSRFLTDIAGHKTKSRSIYFGVHPKIEALIKRPEYYGRPEVIMMFTLAKPPGTYTLYCTLIDAVFKGIGQIDLPISYLKGIFSISEDNYPAFKDFNKRVLRVRVEKINKDSNINVEYQPYREGRKIAGVSFFQRPQAWQQSLLLENMADIADLLEDAGVEVKDAVALVEKRYIKALKDAEILSFPECWGEAITRGLNDDQAADLYATGEYNDELVLMILRKVSEYEKKNKIKNPSGLYYDAFKNKWGEGELKESKEKEIRKETLRRNEEEEERRRAKEGERKKEERSRQQKKVDSVFCRLSEEEQQATLAEIREGLNRWERKHFDKDPTSPVVVIRYYRHLIKKYLREDPV